MDRERTMEGRMKAFLEKDAQIVAQGMDGDPFAVHDVGAFAGRKAGANLR